MLPVLLNYINKLLSTLFWHSGIILYRCFYPKLDQLVATSTEKQCSLQDKMRFYGLCPALLPHYLLEKWNSRHVVIALRGFTWKFNRKMRDAGIWVWPECRLAKEVHKAHKQMWWWEGCWMDALTPILFSFSSSVSLEERFLQIFGAKTYFRSNQVQASLK